MIRLIITYYALINGVEPDLALSIAKVESSLNPKAVSSTMDGGLFQLNKQYYKFHNPNWLFDVEINTALALHTLGKLKEECFHKANKTFVLCYNLGRTGASRIKFPEKHRYYKKVIEKLNEKNDKYRK
jgi:soluble lytic murein transglycosylase-like protein